MKKFLTAVALVVYTLVSCGIVVNTHYCMDKLRSVQLFAAKARECGDCGMDMHKNSGCCRDEVVVKKLVDDQTQGGFIVFLLAAPEKTLPAATSLSSLSSGINGGELPGFRHPPPDLYGQDTYLRVQVFRI